MEGRARGQGVVLPATAAVGAAAALAPVLNWALVDAARLGLRGAALANGAVQAVALAALGGYVVARERAMKGQAASAWPGWCACADRPRKGAEARGLSCVELCQELIWCFRGGRAKAGAEQGPHKTKNKLP